MVLQLVGNYYFSNVIHNTTMAYYEVYISFLSTSLWPTTVIRPGKTSDTLLELLRKIWASYCLELIKIAQYTQVQQYFVEDSVNPHI